MQVDAGTISPAMHSPLPPPLVPSLSPPTRQDTMTLENAPNNTKALDLEAKDTLLAPPVASPKVLRTQGVAVVSLLLLIVLCVMWELSWAPIKPGGSWLAIKALPLVLPLAGFLKRRLYTFRWVSLVIWLYFIEGVVRAYSDPWPTSALALVEIALCLILFFSCALHVKFRFQAAAAQTP